MDTFISDLSKKEFPVSEMVQAKTVRKSVMNLIQKDHPEFTRKQVLSASELASYREKYITKYLISQIGKLSELERNVLESINNRTLISDKDDIDDDKGLTLGQKVADKVANFGGSWTFILSFIAFLLIWIAVNAFALLNRGFDPYPFILLNLILSCLAALQAPVIMMSQNRQGEKDRERARKDYMINLKSELEIRTLHEKIDHLIMQQQQDLIDAQKTQIQAITSIINHIEEQKSKNAPGL